MMRIFPPHRPQANGSTWKVRRSIWARCFRFTFSTLEGSWAWAGPWGVWSLDGSFLLQVLEARRHRWGTVKGWQRQGGTVSGDYVAASGWFTFVNAGGQLVVLNRDDGTLRAGPIRGAAAGSSPLAGRSAISYLDEGHRIMMARLEPSMGSDEGAGDLPALSVTE